MEKQIRPDNLFVARKKGLTALAAVIFAAVGLFSLIAFPLTITKFPTEDRTVMILLCIAFPIISVYALIISALNIRNLFFRYVLTADEKGIYNYSGFFHYGFLSWEDISSVNKEATILDFLDNEAACIRISLTDPKEYKRAQPFGRKWLLFWGGGNVKIYTLCSRVRKKQLCGLLDYSYGYYRQRKEND